MQFAMATTVEPGGWLHHVSHVSRVVDTYARTHVRTHARTHARRIIEHRTEYNNNNNNNYKKQYSSYIAPHPNNCSGFIVVMVILITF